MVVVSNLDDSSSICTVWVLRSTSWCSRWLVRRMASVTDAAVRMSDSVVLSLEVSTHAQRELRIQALALFQGLGAPAQQLLSVLDLLLGDGVAQLQVCLAQVGHEPASVICVSSVTKRVHARTCCSVAADA